MFKVKCSFDVMFCGGVFTLLFMMCNYNLYKLLSL